MLSAGVDLELAVHLTAQRALRQHALDGDLDHALRVTLKRLLQRLGLQVADVAGEAMVLLVLQLLAGNGNLVGIDDDQVITGVNMRGVDRLVLATQAASQLGGKTAQRLAGGVNEVPVALDGLVLCSESAHKELR
ncbi:hypothetical protein D3C81_1827470 [compost metagenome]